MSTTDALLAGALRALPPKPGEDARRQAKQAYSQKVSEKIALAFAAELRHRGLKGTRPAEAGVLGKSGAERRMAGGIGAKKVDVTWATEESGLIFAISIKSINFADRKTRNFQKNLTNRRGDMLFESVTLHRRFPYAVLGGFVFLDAGAARDGTEKRESTFDNAHARFRIFTDRDDPAGRDEQYERLYIVLLDTANADCPFRVFKVGQPKQPVELSTVFGEFIDLIAGRNPDLYRAQDGRLLRQSG